jgi:transcriptional regulator with XRE-family HTH domain
VKRLREQMGLTQEAFAKLVGVHPMTVSRWERGVVNVPAPTAKLIRILAKGTRR